MTGKPYTRLFASDDRAVSEVIGAILVFALLVAMLAIVQAQAVPATNEEVEFEHHQKTQQDLSQLQAAISQTSLSGETQSTSVQLGTTYPPRLVFFNPSAPSGSLRTTAEGNVELANALALNEETADYLAAGSTISNIETSTLVYEPNYNLLEGAPTTVYEHSVFYNDFGDDLVIKNRGQLVDGRQIGLVTLTSSVSETGIQSKSVSTVPVSAPARTVSVQSDPATSGDPISITIPTRLSEEEWVQDILASQIDESNFGPSAPEDCDDLDPSSSVNGDGRYIINCDFTTGSPDTIELVFQEEENGNPVVYELRMSQVGIGDAFDRPEGHYVTTVGGSTRTVETGDAVTLTAEVRDKFNNPVSGVEVEFRDATGATIATVQTDENGQATLTQPLSAGTVTAVADIPSSSPLDQAEFTVQTIGQPANPVKLTSAGMLSQRSSTFTLTLNNPQAQPRTIERIQLHYITNNEEIDVLESIAGPSPTTVPVSRAADGPNEIQDIVIGSNTFDLSTLAASGSPNEPVENQDVYEFQSGTGPTLAAGSTETLEFRTDDTIDIRGDFGSVEVSITLYYDNGNHETYQVHIYDPSGTHS